LVTRRPATGICETTVLDGVIGAIGARGRIAPAAPGAVGLGTDAMAAGSASMLVMCRPMAVTRAEAAERLRPTRFGMT